MPITRAVAVEERPAGVAAIDLRVGLDRVRDGEPARGERVDRAAGGRDDADGQRALLAERASDRGDRLADDDLRRSRRAGRGRGAWSAGVTRITPTSLKRSQPTTRPPIRSPSANSTYTALRALDVRPRLRGVRDDVRVREDHAVAVDDEARALRRAVDPQVRVDGDDTGRARGVERLRVEAPSRRGVRGSGEVGADGAEAGARLDDRRRAPADAGDRADEQRRRRADRSGDDGEARGCHATHRGHRSNGRRVSTWKRRAPASGRFHVETASSPAATAAAGSESVNVVRSVAPLSSTVPPIRSASSRAIARPRPLPDACGPSTR